MLHRSSSQIPCTQRNIVIVKEGVMPLLSPSGLWRKATLTTAFHTEHHSTGLLRDCWMNRVSCVKYVEKRHICGHYRAWLWGRHWTAQSCQDRGIAEHTPKHRCKYICILLCTKLWVLGLSFEWEVLKSYFECLKPLKVLDMPTKKAHLNQQKYVF